MPLIEGFGDEVVCLLAFLLSLVLVASAWISTRVVDGGTLVSVVLLDRERFTGMLQRVRERVGSASSNTPQAQLSSANDPNTATGSHGLNSNQAETHEQQLPVSTSERSQLQRDGESLPLQEEVSPGGSSRLQRAVLGHMEPEASGCSNDTSTLTAITTKSDNKPQQSTLVPDTDIQISTLPLVDLHAQAEPSNGSSATAVASEGGSSVTSSKGENLTNNLESQAEEVVTEGTSNLSATATEHIRIKLQYVDGRQRMVHSHPDSTVGVFKRTEFSEQLTDGRTVRFVINGQELRDDSMTLRACSVGDGSVIHCLVSQPSSSLPPQSSHENRRGAGAGHWDLGVLMFPLFGCVLVALWYARVMYRGFFNAASTFSLIAVSFLYLVGMLASWRNHVQPAHAHAE